MSKQRQEEKKDNLQNKEHIKQNNRDNNNTRIAMISQGLLVDVRLAAGEINYLWDSINNSPKEDARKKLAGNISKSEFVQDKDNWFYENVLAHWSEHLFFKNWNNYYDVHIARTFPPPVFGLKELWVNYQKQHEFQPPHNHRGAFSFVIFMKIPYHWKEQHALPIAEVTNNPCVSNFQFILDNSVGGGIFPLHYKLSPEDEGRMLFFPAHMMHQVFPFYECEEERITISGNIFMKENPHLLNGDANEY